MMRRMGVAGASALAYLWYHYGYERQGVAGPDSRARMSGGMPTENRSDRQSDASRRDNTPSTNNQQQNTAFHPTTARDVKGIGAGAGPQASIKT